MGFCLLPVKNIGRICASEVVRTVTRKVVLLINVILLYKDRLINVSGDDVDLGWPAAAGASLIPLPAVLFFLILRSIYFPVQMESWKPDSKP
jgi:hypothetical protein